MKNNYVVIIIVAVVVGALSFYGGMQYAGSKKTAGNFGPNGRQGNFVVRGAGGQNRGAAGGGLVNGSILSKDDKSITIKVTDGGSKIIFFSDTTEISKFVAGMSADLVVGKTVTVTGKANSDGSITATSIQLRPNMPSPNPSLAK